MLLCSRATTGFEPLLAPRFHSHNPLFFGWSRIKLEHKIINCPHCGKIISKDDNSERPKVTCPDCGSQRNCKDGKRNGKVQRYLCRECGYRFFMTSLLCAAKWKSILMVHNEIKIKLMLNSSNNRGPSGKQRYLCRGNKANIRCFSPCLLTMNLEKR
jgi:DNA-directed RNA polymerase subunit RPC12/RpoP